MPPIGALAKVGVGLEGTAGVPVKSQVYVPFLSETLRGRGKPIDLRSINANRFNFSVIPGPYQVSGDLIFNLTADKCTKLLYGLFGNLAGSGAADPYTLTFKPNSTLSPLTVQIQRSDWFHVYSGLYVQRMRLHGVMDRAVEVTMSLAGIGYEWLMSAEQSDGGIASPADDPFAFWEGRVSFQGAAANSGTGTITSTGGTAVAGTTTVFTTQVNPGDYITANGQTVNVASVQSDTALTLISPGFSPDVTTQGFQYQNVNPDTDGWDFEINTGLQFHKGLNAIRVPNRAYPGESVVTAKFSMLFNTVTELTKFLGQPVGTALPIKLTNNLPSLKTFAMQLDFLGVGSNNPTKNRQAKLLMPVAYYNSVEPEVRDKQGLVLCAMEAQAKYDSVSATDAYLVMQSPESAATITTAGTAMT